MILGFAHPCLVVPDLEKACAFYETMFGFRHFCDEGWNDDPVVNKAIGVSGSSCRGVTLAGHNCYLELFEFESPGPDGKDPGQLAPYEPGIRHLCFHVDDARAEYRRLVELGGTALGEPTDIGGGAYVVYCRDPFGNIIELAEPSTANDDLCILPGVNKLGGYAG